MTRAAAVRAADPWTARLPDGGPWYVETEAHARFDPTRFVVEPWNAASAAAFVLLAVVWLLRLRGRYENYPALSAGLVVLLAGGVGGTLFHALRTSPVFLWLDVGPIGLLGVSAGLVLWRRARLPWWGLAGLLAAGGLLQWAVKDWPHQAVILSQYLSLAVLLLTPVAVALARQRFRHGVWILLALAFFGVAVGFRWADVLRPPALPMGTHWLWHLAGAAATDAVLEYLYRSQPRRRVGAGGSGAGCNGTGPSESDTVGSTSCGRTAMKGE